MDVKITTQAGGTIEIADAAEVQIADGPIQPDFVTKKVSPEGTPITVTPINQ